MTTHAYLYHDGTTLDENDLNPPTATGGYNNGDDMWDKFIRKHENIVLVISGHDPWNRIVSTHVKGDNGNTVTQLLVNPQGLDESIAPTGMVAMLYFSEDGSDVSVEWYSTIQERYYKSDNQFDIVLPLATTAENPDDIPVESNPAGSTSQGTEIQYGVSKSYIVMVPSVVDFGYGGVSTTSTVSASEVLIDGGTKLVITISSYNDWKMVTENDDDNLPVDYTVNLVKNQPDNSVDILENGDVVLTVPCAAPGLEGEAILYFDNSGTNQAGRYLDLLTFTVAIE